MSFKNKNYTNNQPTRLHRINNFIKAYNVRVIFEGEQLGVISLDSALRLASSKGLDLVEIIPNSKPPVCHILNYEKYIYKLKLKEKDKNKLLKNDFKEIRFKSCIHDHDLLTKANHTKGFLESGKRVQITLKFKSGRELSHKENGFKLVDKFLSYVGDIFVFEKKPFVSGDQIFCKLISKNQKK